MSKHIETLALHAAPIPSLKDNEPIAPPIVLGTTFERAPDGEYKQGFSYTRAGNPNRLQWEETLARLEGGAAAAAFASGSAATLAVMHALAPGDHVIVTAGFYGTTNIVEKLMGPWGLKSSMVNTSDLDAVRAAIRPQTRLVWAETPSNPLLRVSDLAALADVAHKNNARLACDNTVATPLLQRCVDLGADLIMHSATKYLSGHSDVLGGAIVAREDGDFFQRIRTFQTAGGGVASPFNCWLAQRGVQTLPLRLMKQCENALALAHFLGKHPKVERCLYPGLPSHPGHAIAKKQMKAFGGLLSILVRGGAKEALRLTGSCQLIKRATSLGGTESTIDHRASVEPAGFGTPQNLLRLSVGIEHVDDLIADLEQALERA